MSAATVKLRKKATEFEQKKQYQKALDTYVQLIESARGTEEENDAALFNRVGDLHLRLNNITDAVTFYERAVDLYTEAGYFNNAIALCNKILRHAPNRNAVYYKLGKISATKGFNSDAKKNFLEYADRMQRIDNLDEAFRALEEFADLCPGQDDIRLMLAEQLSRANRKPEALEQLQRLYETLNAEGRRSEAAAALERMRALDPDVQPRTAAAPRVKTSDGLVFLDVGFDDDVVPPGVPVAGLEPTSLADDADGIADDAVMDQTMTPMVADPPAVDLPFLIESSSEDPLPPGTAAEAEDGEFVDLGEWLREETEPKSSRMIARDDKRVGEEQADFADMLAKFKEGVAANIEAEDFDSHYDLGVAYREMGLIDEAIAEFQKAVRGQTKRVRAYEAIGQSFIDKQQFAVAHSVLMRAVKEPLTAGGPAAEHEMVGIHYLLGLACENLQRYSEASSYYQKVLADDIGFRDVLERLNAVTEMAR